MSCEKIEIEAKHEFTVEQVEDLITTAFEGGTNYWAKISPRWPEGKSREDFPSSDDGWFWHVHLPFTEGGGVEVWDNEDPEKLLGVLDRAAAIKGLELLANKHPYHWAAFVSLNFDADTGDAFVQLAVLGEIVYG